MLLVDLVAAIVVALLATLAAVPLLGWRLPHRAGAGVSALAFFSLTLVAAWAGASWLGPGGPASWVGALAAGVVLLLLALAATPPPPVEEAQVPAAELSTAAAVGAGVFFWALLGVVIAGLLSVLLLNALAT